MESLFGDGIVHFEEFLTIMTIKMKENLAEKLKETFKVGDRDQDGFIFAIELRNVMINLGEKLSDGEDGQIIKEVDVDRDVLQLHGCTWHFTYDLYVSIFWNIKISYYKYYKSRYRTKFCSRAVIEIPSQCIT